MVNRSASPAAQADRSTTPSSPRPVTNVPSGAVRAPRPGRSNTRVVLAVLLIVAGAAIGGALYLAGDSRTQVVVAARDIPVGTVITAGDLTSGEMSGSGVGAIAGADASRLLGQYATTRIPAGALLHADMVDPSPPPGEGRVAVGLALAAGQLPAAELTPDRVVQLLQVPPASESAAGSTAEAPVSSVLVDDALVLSVTSDPSGAWLVTVAVAEADAPAVAAAAAAGRISVGLLPVSATTDREAADDSQASRAPAGGAEGEG